MNDNTTNETAPTTAATTNAEKYVKTELKRAKDALLRTQIGAAIAVFALGGYTLHLTSKFRASMEPKEAATIAQGLLAQKVDEGGTQIAEFVKAEVPKVIRQAPDYAMKQLPEFRQQLTSEVTTEVERYAKESSEQLGGHVDKFLEENKEAVSQLILDGGHYDATVQINRELKKLLVAQLEQPTPDGESIKAKLDHSLDTLNKVEARMKRLATAKDLTPAEKHAKRAIAVLLKTVHDKRVEEGHEDGIAPKLVSQAGEAVKTVVESRTEKE